LWSVSLLGVSVVARGDDRTGGGGRDDGHFHYGGGFSADSDLHSGGLGAAPSAFERRYLGSGGFHSDHRRFDRSYGPGSGVSGYFGRSGSWNLDGPPGAGNYHYSKSYASPPSWSFAAPAAGDGLGLQTILILPAAMPGDPRDEVPPNVTPGVHPAVGILNDPDSGGPVRFLVDGERCLLQPGETLLLPDNRIWSVEFYAAGTEDLRQYSVIDGLYKFKVRGGAWGLFKSKDPAPRPPAVDPQTPPANEVPGELSEKPVAEPSADTGKGTGEQRPAAAESTEGAVPPPSDGQFPSRSTDSSSK
jgi:hypothetical protein